jgi:hypothetical protein
MSDERCERTISKPSVFNLQQVFGTHKVYHRFSGLVIYLFAEGTRPTVIISAYSPIRKLFGAQNFSYGK